MVQARLAIAKSFLEAYSRLPKTQQKKVREFTERFQVGIALPLILRISGTGLNLQSGEEGDSGC